MFGSPEKRVETRPYDHGIEYFLFIQKKGGPLQVGYIRLFTNPTLESTDVISWFEIEAKHRGKGYGDYLLGYALSQSKTKYQRLSVGGDNQYARRLYKKHGFVEVSRTEGKNGEEDIIILQRTAP